MISGHEIITARELLGWSTATLARQASLPIQAVRTAEAEALSLPDLGILNLLEETLRRAGIEFISENDGEAGMRLRKTT